MTTADVFELGTGLCLFVIVVCLLIWGYGRK